MFEVNLVPKVKFTALKAQQVRDFIVSVCILANVVVVAVTVVLGVSFGIQRGISVSHSNNIQRIYGEILAEDDVNYVLTLQSQLQELGEIAQGQAVFSRVVGILTNLTPRDPEGVPLILFSELAYRAAEHNLTIEAVARPGLDFAILEQFRKTIDAAFFDYGQYYGPDGLPVTVAHERVDTLRCLDISGDVSALQPCGTRGTANPRYGWIYGVYVIPGTDPNNCIERPWQPICENDVQATPPRVVHIYRDGQDHDGFFYEGECIEADGITSRCKLVESETIRTADIAFGRDGAGALALRFTIMFDLSPEALNLQNQNVRLVGIPRQNVTDSYLQINTQWFTARPSDCEPGDVVCEGMRQ
ncbi:hypothetical protein FWH13_03115 [Candidatus Saccharibacteria bacterium]|nr:hypothetical protein [Candidatus Saccharibacteria bacterium]